MISFQINLLIISQLTFLTWFTNLLFIYIFTFSSLLKNLGGGAQERQFIQLLLPPFISTSFLIFPLQIFLFSLNILGLSEKEFIQFLFLLFLSSSLLFSPCKSEAKTAIGTIKYILFSLLIFEMNLPVLFVFVKFSYKVVYIMYLICYHVVQQHIKINTVERTYS